MIKRLIITSLFFMLGFISFGQTGIMRIDNFYKNYNTQFAKLAENEFFVYEYDEGKRFLNLFAENIDTKAKRDFAVFKVDWGAYQFSESRKRGIIFLPLEGEFYVPMFLINGTAGTITYVMNVMQNTRSDRDVKYVLFQQLHTDKTKYAVLDLEKRNIIHTFEWKLKDAEVLGGLVEIYRSLDQKYDFRIDIDVELTVAARSFYNIKENKLVEIFDKTNLGDLSFHEREPILKEEMGS